MRGAVSPRLEDEHPRRPPPIHRLRRLPTPRCLAIMGLALRDIEADFGPENADTSRHALHPDLHAA